MDNGLAMSIAVDFYALGWCNHLVLFVPSSDEVADAGRGMNVLGCSSLSQIMIMEPSTGGLTSLVLETIFPCTTIQVK